MHYPHHDTSNKLMNSNYGNFLSIWDRMFGTYTDEQVKTFGVDGVSPEESKKLSHLIMLPFLK